MSRRSRKALTTGTFHERDSSMTNMTNTIPYLSYILIGGANTVGPEFVLSS